MTQEEIQELYKKNCETPSDINELLPILKEYYDRCEHITEMGVRGCISLSAALASNAKKVVAYDIMNVSVPECDKLQFICASTLEIEIKPTDMLFIDTAHYKEQLEKELNLHANKVNKFLAFHDIKTFWENGDNGGQGLKYAIEPFLENNTEWIVEYRTDANNGLLVLKRV